MSNHKKRVLRLARRHFAAVFLIVALAASLPAQTTTGTISGTVTDSTGAVIPGANVTLTYINQGSRQTRSSDATGTFQFDFLRPGDYQVTIEADGFKRLERTGIALTAGQQIRQSFPLEVGAVNEVIKVESSAPLVNTVSAVQLETFEQQKVKELPLPRRNFSALLGVGAGMVSTGDSVRMNGVGKNGTAFSVDGVDASGNPEGRTSSTYQQVNYIDLMSVEAIQEVTSVKGIVPAEFGNAVGGQVNLITKSGTNSYHGSLFHNFQAENLNARNQRLSNKPAFTFNQFGGSFGGPVIKDKVFAFGVYEGYRESGFQLVQGNVPTQKLRNEMLAAVPSYKLALDWFPLPNQATSPTDDVGLFVSAGSARRTDNHADIKGDIQINSTSRLSLSYSRGRPYRYSPNIFVNGGNDRTWSTWQERGVASYVTGGASWTSESRFGYNLTDMSRLDAYFTQFDPNKSTEAFEFGRRLPRLSTNLGFGGPSAELYLLEGRNWNFDQKIAMIRGNHSLKFGGGIWHLRGLKTNPENPDIQYIGKADLLANSPSTVTPTFGSGVFNARMYEFGFFAQDDWRIRPNLVLNLGLRYDYFSNLRADPTEKCPTCGFYNPSSISFPNFDLGAYRDTSNPYNSDAGLNLQPRVGFSYNPDGNSKTVIRGGFGMMFSSQMAGAMWPSVQSSPVVPFRTFFTRNESQDYNIKWPSYNDDMRTIVEAQNAASGKQFVFSVFNPNLQNPYTMNFNLGIQRTLTNSLMMEVSYVGMRGVKFLMQRWANEIDRITGDRPNPNAGRFYYVDMSQNTNYNALQTSIRKRFSMNFSGSIHYTWGRSLSTAGGDVGAYFQGDADVRTQQFFYPKNDYGPSTGDIQHYVAAEGLYELPNFRNRNMFVKNVLGGWQVSTIFRANTGEPVILTQSSAINASRPDYVGGNPVFDNFRQTLQFLNPAAFSPVPIDPNSRATVRPGNVGNGAVRAPGQVNFDISFAKNIQVKEGVRFQLRTDMFNAFNHTNLSGLRTNINDRFFGQLLGTRGARVIQLNARLTF